ncbi:Ubiquinone/menaquinone biosynthesis C-methylase UbiE [Tistlia consotensis]|uniref:Ubiquinone/menaquinone biosynthesis C-methylase UbiE n=1 Tax=Tistlia consotensis USBA 355 TaxID=560819 RepID=A0A1Y6CQ04_9PROT|nr:class I SAM-dependent methyltransferase [Tistlia consotensis]SMF69721.1 Ubiquinone/menaquinone biosynthesis C-methylase UbiE [Tistlia consotensis USBA 355]SNS05459.1 Ubiquinone/menaquinone biosynthesis C-methylase UbiE [Tistlia consotensis]
MDERKARNGMQEAAPGGDQAARWNGPAGRAWVEAQAALDALFEPFERLLAGQVPEGSAAGVLDVGCGTGATTLAIARRLGPGGRCLGLDLSAPMLARARERAAAEGSPARFLQADAAGHAFEPAAFDLIVSRFGVMFFDDPVRAFANLRAAAKPGAALRCIAWRSPGENPFMTTAERAAAPLLPPLPPRVPDAPGQFAFADPERVRGILEDSGWTAVALRPLDVPCRLPAADLQRYITRMGPVGTALQQADAATRARVVAALEAAFAAYVAEGEARFTAACWLVEATAAKER